MRFSLKRAEIISYFIAGILGAVFHFVYEWSGNHPVIGLFFPVSESTWEHLKLIFFPILLVSLPEYFLLEKKQKGFFGIKFISALLGMLLTVVLFYTYSGVIGKNIDWLNIAIYLLALAASFFYSFRTLNAQKGAGFPPLFCCLGILLMVVLFCIFSFRPPEIGLFLSPVLLL